MAAETGPQEMEAKVEVRVERGAQKEGKESRTAKVTVERGTEKEGKENGVAAESGTLEEIEAQVAAERGIPKDGTETENRNRSRGKTEKSPQYVNTTAKIREGTYILCQGIKT